MDSNTFITILLIALFLLWLLYFLLRTPSNRRSTRGGGFGSSQSWDEGEGDFFPSESLEQKNTRLAKKSQRIKDILQKDPIFTGQLNRLAGKDVGEILSTSTTSREALAVADRIPEDMLRVFEVALSQKDIELNLASESHRNPVAYPTNDMEPQQMTDYSQMSEIPPEQMVLLSDDDEFYAALVQEQIYIIQAHETTTVKRRAYILLDISGSMAGRMRDGMERHVWSRGVTISLLRRAIAGEAEFYVRPFSGTPHRLMRARTAEEAADLIQPILDSGYSGSGTDILAAIEQSADDIRNNKGEIGMTDVLLISDGEDQYAISSKLKRILGDDIRLHVASIGTENLHLRDVATSYQVFY